MSSKRLTEHYAPSLWERIVAAFKAMFRGKATGMIILIGALASTMACGASRAANTIGNLAAAPTSDSGTYKSSTIRETSEVTKDSAGAKVKTTKTVITTDKSRVAVSADAREQAINAIGAIGVAHEKNRNSSVCWTCGGGYMQPIATWGMPVIGGQNYIGNAQVGVSNVGTRGGGGGGGVNVIVRTP